MSWMRYIFLTDIIVDHVSNRIQLGFMMSVSDILVVFCVMVSHTCSNFDLARVLSVYDGEFPTWCPISWQRYHVTYANYLL